VGQAIVLKKQYFNDLMDSKGGWTREFSAYFQQFKGAGHNKFQRLDANFVDVVGMAGATMRGSRAKLLDYFFTPKTASFAALATRNLTTVLAGILIFCCVFGLKPVRASSSASPACRNRVRQIRRSF
jgi:hypothetical protein